MLVVFVAVLLFAAGCARMPWWSPLAAFGLGALVVLLQFYSDDSWRDDAELAALTPMAVIANILVTLVLLFMAYGLGRGLARLFRRRPIKTASPVSLDSDLH